MSLTYEQAYDELLTMISAAWQETGLPIFYESLDTERGNNEQSNIKVWIRHLDGGQRTLGGVGRRIFRRRGQVTMEVRSRTGKGLSESYQLAKVAADAFEGKRSPGGIWFRNVRISERGNDGIFNVTAVFADFQYDEVK